jgi:hypothetical protein
MRTMHWGRLAAVAATGVVALATGLGTGGGAQAATPTGHSVARPASVDSLGCPSGDACFWVNDDYQGTMGHVAGNNPNFMNLSNSSGCTAYPGTWNDCISSLDNNGTECVVYFWTDANYKGSYHSVALGDKIWDFGAVYNDPSFNDSISSNHWCNPTS